MYRRLLVPVDGSAPSDEALARALEIAGASGGQVLLVHALDSLVPGPHHAAGGALRRVRFEEGERVLQRALAIADDSEISARTRLLDQPRRRLGEIVAEVAQSWPADLIVVGSHGRHGVARALLGSGAEQVLRLAPVPVLVVRSVAAAMAA